MSAELEPVINAEIVVEPAPLSETEAKRLDKKIRLIVGNISDELDKLAALIAEAKAGSIHIALGHKSWTAYLASVAEIGWQNRDDRRKVVALLSGEGMSQRAIASAVGVSKQTVQADQKQVDDNHPPVEFTVTHEGRDHIRESSKVIGLDGKRYPKPEPKQRRSFTYDIDWCRSRFNRCANMIDNLAKRAEDLKDDDRYPKYREEFDDRIGNVVVNLVAWASPNLTREQWNRIAMAAPPEHRVDDDEVDAAMKPFSG